MNKYGSDILGPDSIPPRTTKIHDSPLVGLFSFGVWQSERP